MRPTSTPCFMLLLTVLARTAHAQGSDNNSILQNIAALNQTQDDPATGNTYHISIVAGYARQYLTQYLDAKSHITFFAPSDHSFERLSLEHPDFYAQFVADPELIRDTLREQEKITGGWGAGGGHTHHTAHGY
ncbi:hypothetical protein BDK51DRAFT_38500 [Blyttiomyces helicus]|uniref:FAS1 domain-containing protein n=1 Tax=Blyttiomyces helicus TaxID=388810 RepID=A0A4P9WAI1_9FUNG|nr:hypothetical protein BDK51DRAFT_38500 [Blyttiomyces helicus]|eukprot:RKO87246.1 hypothetical protein BDK51DRAFT_38500 [Blyttiomyces helicus]